MSTGPYEVKKVDTKQLLGDFSQRMNEIAKILEEHKVRRDKHTYLSLLCLAMAMIKAAKNCSHERAVDETINILNILRAGV